MATPGTESSGNGGKEFMFSSLEAIMNSFSKLGEQVTLETHSRFALITHQLQELWREMECLQVMVTTLVRKMDTLKIKVEGIEVKAELAAVGFLKEVYGLCDRPLGICEAHEHSSPQDQRMEDPTAQENKEDEAKLVPSSVEFFGVYIK